MNLSVFVNEVVDINLERLKNASLIDHSMMSN